MVRKLAAVVGSTLLTAVCLVVSSGAAQAVPARGLDEPVEASSPSPTDVSVASSLFHCKIPDPYPPGYVVKPCTRITSAPASGVQVRDHLTNRTKTLYNGDTVYLHTWSRDRTGLCGVNGNSYVWYIGWVDPGGAHGAFIGDHYLATGGVDHWYWFRTKPGGSQVLGDLDQGWGGGACNIYPYG